MVESGAVQATFCGHDHSSDVLVSVCYMRPGSKSLAGERWNKNVDIYIRSIYMCLDVSSQHIFEKQEAKCVLVTLTALAASS